MAEVFANDCVTKLNGAITSGATTLIVANATGFPTTGQFRIRIDNEIMTVTGVSGNVFTVTRASEKVRGIQIATAHNDKSVVAHDITAGGLGGIGVSFDAAANLFIGGGGTTATRDNVNDLGTDNIAIGSGSIDYSDTDPALADITDGVGNVAIGSGSMSAMTTGYQNIALGHEAMYDLTTGGDNICIGAGGAFGLTTGSNNVFLGEWGHN